jgi:hypothetical protein
VDVRSGRLLQALNLRQYQAWSCAAVRVRRRINVAATAKHLIATIGAVTILSGCASVKEYATLKTPANRTLRASQGQIVFRVDKAKDLPNLWGRADLFGEKVSIGYDELRYMGMADDRILIFSVYQVTVDSNETTMSRRSPMLNTLGAITAPLGQRRQASEQTYEIRHSIAESRLLDHAGIKVAIIEATPNLLTYTLAREE